MKNKEQENPTLAENFEDKNIFYVISKRKGAKYTLEETPRLGHINEDNEIYTQSLCVADNALVLSECISTDSIIGEENVLYFFLNLKVLKFFIEEMNKEKNKSNENKSKTLDVSKGFSLFDKKDIWVYFYKKNSRVYRFFWAKNENELFDFIEDKGVEFQPRVLASLNDLEKIKEHLENIKFGKESNYNKIESI